jgi:hypothetical protein
MSSSRSPLRDAAPFQLRVLHPHPVHTLRQPRNLPATQRSQSESVFGYGEEIFQIFGVDGVCLSGAAEVGDLSTGIEEEAMGRASDVSLEHWNTHEELERLDEALRCKVTVAYGEYAGLPED